MWRQGCHYEYFVRYVLVIPAVAQWQKVIRGPLATELAGIQTNVVSAGLFAAYGAKPTEEAVIGIQSIADISGHESRPRQWSLSIQRI